MVIESSASWLAVLAMYRAWALFASDRGENEAASSQAARKTG
jgi:hypothetical protein